MPERLVDRSPRVPVDRHVADLVPPPRFEAARFDTYRPDPGEPTQTSAVVTLRAFAGRLADSGAQRSALRRALRRTPTPRGPAGIYLDGGFGVGKTHLLASLWHVAPPPRAFGTFVELTNLVGALGFQATVEALSGQRLLCIDEFELDDPGDTVLMSSLLGRLVDAGVGLAASSNTLPGTLGEGRFAAEDFTREIAALSAHFQVVRIEGEDFRHRGRSGAPAAYDDALVVQRAGTAGAGATLDDFDALLRHLATLHPSRYGALLDGVTAVHLRALHPVTDQAVALRLVVLADRLYDRAVPVVAGGVPLDALFPTEMLRGGYRKKYLRTISRLTSLARQGSAE